MTDTKSPLGVAIVGCGTVGGAAATILTHDASVLAAKVRRPVELRHVVDVNFDNAHRCGLDTSLLTDDLAKVLSDDGVHVVVELIGGTTFARDVIKQAVAAGKHVVTANKALLAEHGTELFAMARSGGVCIAFEASCAGGVPIIRALTGGLLANRIDAVYGIVNGTCNYILTEMTRSGRTYAEALADAQADGLAEADPTLDVGGFDSAHKLAILASLAFRRRIDFHAIPVQGIDTLDLQDIRYGRELGYVVKLMAIGQRQADGVSLRVRPAFISLEHPLAWVSGPFNAVSVYGHATGHTMYYGRGAGGMPTASAVVADLADIAMGVAPATFKGLSIYGDQAEQAGQLPFEAIRSRYYLRMLVSDRPGVLARITTLLGERGISIFSVLQHEPPDDAGQQNAVPLVITTHKAQEGDVRQALTDIDALDVVEPPTVCIGIVDEHPEADRVTGA